MGDIMVFLWRYLFGCLTIKITGENSEIILNRALSNKIFVKNLYYKNKEIYGDIAVNRFKDFLKIRRGTGCKIKIVKKFGIAFNIKRYKRRLGFVIGMVVFFITLLSLSNFVWIINVEGNKNISNNEIIYSCKKIGIYEGLNKSKVKNKYDAQRLQLVQKGIAWCSFNLEGCVLTVNISETTDLYEKTKETPSNLKASFDGKIKKIDVTSGNVLVKVGDYVSKGQLLVEGLIHNNYGNIFVHSEGEIIAETRRVFSAKGEYIQNKKQVTGLKKCNYTLDVFKFKIPLFLGNVKKQYIYSCDFKKIKLFNKRLPINIIVEKYEFTENCIYKYNKDELEEILKSEIEKQIKKYNFINIDETKKEIIETEDGILLNITYKCEENIAFNSDILLDKQV